MTVPARVPASLDGLLAAIAARSDGIEPVGDDAHLAADLEDALDRGASEEAIFERVRLLDREGYAAWAAATVAGHPDTPRRPDLQLGLAAFLLDALAPDVGLALAEHVASGASPTERFALYRRAHVLVAEGRSAMGDRAGARRAYEAILAFDLDDARALAGLARLGSDAPGSAAPLVRIDGLDDVASSFAGAGRYRIVRPLGRGRHAVVYLAADTRLGREVAVKRFPPPAAWSDPAAARRLTRRFLEEARALERVRSPHVVRLFDVLPSERTVVLEYCAGGSLRRALRTGAVGRDDLSDLAEALRRGLAAIARAGAVHRDVKPANILLRTRAPRFVLADLGLAIPRDRSAERFGALRYLAPELRRGHGTPGPATDAYAAGVVLLEVALGPGRLPAAFDTPEGPRDARRFVPDDLPGPLAQRLARLLDPDPARRLW